MEAAVTVAVVTSKVVVAVVMVNRAVAMAAMAGDTNSHNHTMVD